MEKNYNVIHKTNFIILSLILLVISFIRYETVGNNLSVSDAEIKVASVYLIAAYVYGIFAWLKITGRIASPYFLFFVACFMFNGGQLFMNLFNIENQSFFNIFNHYNNNLILRMILFQTMCVVMLICGSLLAYNDKTGYSLSIGFSSDEAIDKEEDTSHRLSFCDVVFLLSAAYLIILNITRVGMRSDVSYTDAYYSAETSGSYLQATITYIFHVSFFYGFYKNYHNWKRKHYMIIGIIWLILLALYGGRFKLIPLIAGMIFISYMYNIKDGKHLSKWKIVLIVILALFFISLMEGMATIRRQSLSSLSFSYILQVYSGGFLQNLVATLGEAGASARCILETMSQILNGSAHTEQSFLYALATGFLPNGVWNALGFSMENLSLSAWLTNLAHASDGWGYSVFAECFYNLKEFGFICAFCLSFTFVKVEGMVVKMFRNGDAFDIAIGAGLLYFLVDSIFLSRANALLVAPDIRRTFYLLIGITVLRRGKIPYGCLKEEPYKEPYSG